MPSELQITPLRLCLEKIIDYRGKTPKKLGSDWTDRGYRALSAINVKDSGLTSLETIRCVDVATYKKWMKEEVRRGDIFLTSEAPAGEVMIWNSDEKIVLSQRLFCLRTNKGFDNRFIKYYLQCPTGKREVNRTRSGSTVAGISAEMFDQIQVVHPGMRSQQQIGAVLSSLDDKIDLNKRISVELEALAKTIYDYWFVQFDFPDAKGRPYKASGGQMVWNEVLKREIPEGWTVRLLGEVISRCGTGLNPRDNFQLGSGTNYYVTIKNVTDGKIVLDETCDRIDDCAMAIIDRRSQLRSGDVLFTSIEPVGVTYLIRKKPSNWNINESVFTIRPNDREITSEYLLMLLSSQEMKAFTKNSSAGSIHKGIRHSVLKSFGLPYRDKSLIERFSALVKPLLDQLHLLDTETHELIRLRDWLLPLLMNGQVRVTG